MFSDRSGLLRDADPMRGYGVSVTPGRDGPLVFVAGYGEPNRLYAREDDGFVDTACGIVADGDRHGMGVCAADVDADGCEEVYVHNCAKSVGAGGDADLLLDRLEADRYRWTDAFSLPVNADRVAFRAGRSVAALDRLGTGRYGVAVAGYVTPPAFYEFGDDGEASDMADAIGLAVGGGCRSLVPGPLPNGRSDRTGDDVGRAGDDDVDRVGDGDADRFADGGSGGFVDGGSDLFVGVEDGPNRLFRNDRGHYEPVDPDRTLADPNGDACGATLVDEGGTFALVIGNRDGGSRLFSRDPSGRFRDAAPPELTRTEGIRSVVAADFDNDGRQELFCNTLGTPNRLFERVDGGDPTGTIDAADPPETTEGAGTRWEPSDPGAAVEPDGLGTGAIAADLDGDGVLELLVVHGEVAPQPIAVYAAPGAAANGWLRVRPTTQHGAPARGATVRLETTDGVQRRVVDTGGGYLCQTEPVAHFGLGGADPLRVVVRWPDGRERTVSAPTPNAEVDVAHPAADGA